jgi:hypothetical protein
MSPIDNPFTTLITAPCTAILIPGGAARRAHLGDIVVVKHAVFTRNWTIPARSGFNTTIFFLVELHSYLRTTARSSSATRIRLKLQERGKTQQDPVVHGRLFHTTLKLILMLEEMDLTARRNSKTVFVLLRGN